MHTKTQDRFGLSRIMALVIVAAIAISACSGSDSDEVAPPDSTEIEPGIDDSDGNALPSNGLTDASGADEALRAGEDGSSVVFQNAAATFEAKVVRDGRLDIRIEEGDFDSKGAELRVIANEMGGYLSSGESHIEEIEDVRYAVGWFTLRVPTDRFDDTVARVERLGERVSSSLSSQDVTEEYVDLEGRLSYWKQQEAFYSRLMDEATTIDDLVTLQTRMQDVLLNIEQIEGRLRYLDGRTSFATLTVGLTEVPDVVSPVVLEPDPEPGPIAEAFEQAGDVLLATVAFLIVAAAVVIPLGILGIVAFFIVRLFIPRKEQTTIVAEG